MRFRTCSTIAAVVLASAIAAPVAFAQGQGAAPTQPAPATPPAQGGMMGGQGGMMGQGNMMGGGQGGMMGQGNMMGGQGGMMGQGNMMGPNGMCGQAMGKGGMMGGQGNMMQMMPMMQNMMAMMSAETGMMTPFVEGRIAALKSELKITEAQTAQWNRFADTLRATAKSMNEMHRSMMTMRSANAAKPLADRLAARERAMSAHVAALKSEREALQPLYASFSDEQKKIADGLRIGPMGMM